MILIIVINKTQGIVGGGKKKLCDENKCRESNGRKLMKRKKCMVIIINESGWANEQKLEEIVIYNLETTNIKFNFE